MAVTSDKGVDMYAYGSCTNATSSLSAVSRAACPTLCSNDVQALLDARTLSTTPVQPTPWVGVFVFKCDIECANRLACFRTLGGSDGKPKVQFASFMRPIYCDGLPNQSDLGSIISVISMRLELSPRANVFIPASSTDSHTEQFLVADCNVHSEVLLLASVRQHTYTVTFRADDSMAAHDSGFALIRKQSSVLSWDAISSPVNSPRPANQASLGGEDNPFKVHQASRLDHSIPEHSNTVPPPKPSTAPLPQGNVTALVPSKPQPPELIFIRWQSYHADVGQFVDFPVEESLFIEAAFMVG